MVFLRSNTEGNTLSRNTIDTLGITIYTDEIKEVTLDDYTSYTMLIALPESDSTKFYNLTIEDKNGVEGMFMTKYAPTEDWLNDKSKAYEGTIKTARIDVITQEFPPDGGGEVDTNVTNYSLNYPENCDGWINQTTTFVEYACGCGHWPGDNTCTGCVIDEPEWAGYAYVITYECIPYYENNDTDNGSSTNTNTNSSNGPGGPSNTPDDPSDDGSIGATVLPVDCVEPQSVDPSLPCYVSPYNLCLQNNSVEVCDCEAAGGVLEDCIFDEVASTILFKKKEDDEAIPVILEFVLPCFDTENNQDGLHDVTIYVKQPVPNSTQISTGLGNAGHTFIELTQSINGNVVKQFIGLYPDNDDVSPNMPVVDGIFIDDSEEEYDVSLNIELSPEQFNSIIEYLRSFGQINEYGELTDVSPEYDLNEFNCSDFALNIMNFSDIQIPDSTGEWGGSYGFDLGQGTCPALLGQDIRNTDFGPNVVKDLDGGVSGNSTENLCDD